MSTPSDGLIITRQRIAEEATVKTGALHLGGLALDELPPELAALTHLRKLDLSNFRYSGAEDWEQVTPFLGTNTLTSLAPLAGLTKLQNLDCWNTQVSDLTPLARLTALAMINFSGCSLSAIPEQFWRQPQCFAPTPKARASRSFGIRMLLK